MNRNTVSERGLVLAPRGRDAAIGVGILAEAGLRAETREDLAHLIGGLDRGAGFVVITEEALAGGDLRPLARWIDDQEDWSDLPFILLTARGGGLERNPGAGRHLELLGNVTFVERPFHPTTLVSLARSALRGRRKQYEARARLETLRQLNETLEQRVAEAIFEKRLFADIVEATDAMVQVIGPDYRWLAINRAAADEFAASFGARPTVGNSMLELLAGHPEQRARLWELWGRALAGEPVTVTAEADGGDRRRRFHEMRFNTLRDAAGERIGAYQFVYDVTERVGEQQRLARAEEQLHQSQKMEAIGQLTGGVAHDFNNLLSPITGVLDMVRRRYGADARTARLTDGALQAAERAKTLVQRLLVFARRQRLETRAVDVPALIEGMRELIASSIGPGIELRVVKPDEPAAAMADPNQLELALLNLAVNARDAMPRGGRLTFAVEVLSIEPGDAAPAPAGLYVRISVSDTGVGMDKATLRRAVEPFYSTKGLGKGTGLGLSMVHGLAGQLGGAFVLASEPGRGTSADLYLPAAAAPAAPVAASPRDGHVPGSGRSLAILLVDDEDLVRAGAAEMLRELGHEVIEAAGGAEALTKLDRHPAVDVLITDYMMPSIDGAELARRARKRRPDLRVLVITGYGGADLVASSRKIARLAKPFRQADLAQALATLFEPAVAAEVCPADC